MNERSILLIGGPDTGKTNFLARLWAALLARRWALAAPMSVCDIRYVEEALGYLLQGKFAPRSRLGIESAGQGLRIPLQLGDGDPSTILVPDVSGELWTKAVETCQLPEPWMESLRHATGILLFVRMGSALRVESIDWVTSAKYLEYKTEKEYRSSVATVGRAGRRRTGDADASKREIPTDVVLCELLRFLESAPLAAEGQSLRVAVLVTAWDSVEHQLASRGPTAFLELFYPLLAGRLADTPLETRVFGVSVVGGDFVEARFRTAFRKASLENSGYVVCDRPGGVDRFEDMTLPLAWVLRTPGANHGE